MGYTNSFGYAQATDNASAEPTAENLDEPGKGGNGLVAIRFSLVDNFGNQFNPALKVPSTQKVWPNLSKVMVPIAIKQSAGSGYVCISLADPNTPELDFVGSSSILIRLGNISASKISISDVANQLAVKLAKTNIGKSNEDFLIRDKDPWVTNKYLILRIAYSGSDSIATDACENSTSDKAVGGTPLVQYVKIVRIPATQVRSYSVPLKNGRQQG
jgi:hypothetical protein